MCVWLHMVSVTSNPPFLQQLFSRRCFRSLMHIVSIYLALCCRSSVCSSSAWLMYFAVGHAKISVLQHYAPVRHAEECIPHSLCTFSINKSCPFQLPHDPHSNWTQHLSKQFPANPSALSRADKVVQPLFDLLICCSDGDTHHKMQGRLLRLFILGNLATARRALHAHLRSKLHPTAAKSFAELLSPAL